MPVRHRRHRRRGSCEKLLQKRREQLGFSYIVVHDAEIETFAPVVARLAGT